MYIVLLYINIRSYQFNLNTHVEKSWSFVFCILFVGRTALSFFKIPDTISNRIDNLEAFLRQKSLLQIMEIENDNVESFEWNFLSWLCLTSWWINIIDSVWLREKTLRVETLLQSKGENGKVGRRERGKGQITPKLFHRVSRFYYLYSLKIAHNT